MAHILTGTVVSAKMQKTAVVSVESKMRHPLYKKVIVRHKKFKAHYDNITIAEGDQVEITEVKPIARHVHYIISKKFETNKS
ncbi:30S ribosomal protein S17 [Candidatus Microgenomates bacterium]|nr:30S ribosomal protein S17 [Candidatus Microgenomates bacterium]